MVGTIIFSAFFVNAIFIEPSIKHLSNKKRVLIKISLGLLFVIGFTGYLFLSSPDGVVVDETGKIDWVINNARETLQGKRFWRNQLNKVNDRILSGENALIWIPQTSAMHREERMKKNINPDEFYGNYPDAKPSATMQKAGLLRDKADELEGLGKEQYILKMIKQKIESNRRIAKVIEQHFERNGMN